jgi:putative DNA primase/helicase
VQVGRTYYFPDGARAFSDRGKRLTTPSENTEVIRSLVAIAQARGWRDITLAGTERFRKEAWFAAKLVGLDVHGYAANELEHAQLARALGRLGEQEIRTSPERAAAPQNHGDPGDARSDNDHSRKAVRDRRGSLIVGRLVDHGRATYLHDPREGVSYFVKLEDSRGERTIWGVDLERALRESLTKPQPGDEVGLRAVRQDPVTVKAQERDPDGRVVGTKDLATHRNRWIAEKREFFEERRAAARVLRDPSIDPKRAAQDHPALVGTYLNLHAAELAAKQFRDPQDRARFVGLVRNALADAVARGEPLPPVRLREPPATERQAARAPRAHERDPSPVRG